MLKKIILLSLFILSTSSWAGFYLGGAVGPDTNNFKRTGIVRHATDLNVKDTSHVSGTGIFGSLFAGYGGNWQQFYLAGEVNVNASTLQFKSSNDEFVHQHFSHNQYKMNRSYGISLLPGFIFSPATLFYGRLGYVNASFRTYANRDNSFKNVNRDLNGIRFGLGIREVIYQQFSVLMEYNYTAFTSTHIDAIDTVSQTRKRTSITPNTSLVEFGALYSFA